MQLRTGVAALLGRLQAYSQSLEMEVQTNVRYSTVQTTEHSTAIVCEYKLMSHYHYSSFEG